MTTLHDQLHDAVADVTTDLASLAAAARREGLARRRLRRGLATVGTVAAALTVGALASTVVPGATDGVTVLDVTSSPTATASATPAPMAEQTRLTGRSAAAILIDLVGAQVPAAVENDSIGGSGGVAYADADGNVVLTAAQNSGAYAELRVVGPGDEALLAVNVDPLAAFAQAGRCATTDLPDCRERRLANGDLLVTYTDDQVDKPDEVRRVATLFSQARGVRVVVGSTVAPGATNPMSVDQLAEVATDPVWSLTVPSEYADQGAALTSYSWLLDMGAATPVESIHTPAPDVG